MRRCIFGNAEFELTEIRDFPDDPAPRLKLDWLTAQRGNGRCQCGRHAAAVSVVAEIEEEEAIRLCRAIIAHYSFKEARKVARGRAAERVRGTIEKFFSRELQFLQRWESELSGRDYLDDA